MRARSKRPDVQIVDSGDPRHAEHFALHLARIYTGRCTFEQHIGCVFEHAKHANDDDGRNEQRKQRIDPRRVRHDNERTAHDDGKRAERVSEDVKECRTNVEILVTIVRQRKTEGGSTGAVGTNSS